MCIRDRYHTPYFAHIWGGGYSAGYYAYMWSDMLNSSAWDWITKPVSYTHLDVYKRQKRHEKLLALRAS